MPLIQFSLQTFCGKNCQSQKFLLSCAVRLPRFELIDIVVTELECSIRMYLRTLLLKMCIYCWHVNIGLHAQASVGIACVALCGVFGYVSNILECNNVCTLTPLRLKIALRLKYQCMLVCETASQVNTQRPVSVYSFIFLLFFTSSLVRLKPLNVVYFVTFLLRIALLKPRARWDGWLRRAKWTKEFDSRQRCPPVRRAHRPTHPPPVQQ